jgi:hypothetical protein
MRKWFVTPVVAALLLVAGCDERPLTTVEYDPDATFSGFKTYRWLEDSGRITADRPQVEPEVRERVVRAVDRALAEKGFTLSTGATADFQVGYHVGLNRRPDVRSMNAYYNYPPGWAWDHYHYGRDLAPKDADQPSMVLEDKGAVVIDVATATEVRLIWRGTAYTVVPERRPASVDQEWFDKRAKELFEQFPPAP